MWKADKSCKWFMSWCKSINNEETNVAKGREGFGTRTSKKKDIFLFLGQVSLETFSK